MDFQINDNEWNGKSVYRTERKVFTVSRHHLDLLTDQLWDKMQEVREETKGYVSLRFMYRGEGASPVGIGTLPYDWAKIGESPKYKGLDSLEGNRLEIIVDVPGKKGGLDFGCLAVIEKEDKDYALVHLNQVNALVNPQPFYEMIRGHSHSEESTQKNRSEYVSKTRLFFGYWLNRLRRGNPNKLDKSITEDIRKKMDEE